jgi:hypothetical protein
MIGKPQVAEVLASSGATYQLEAQVQWDGMPDGNVRALVAIDDGGARAFKLMTDDFILAPNGTFLGE